MLFVQKSDATWLGYKENVLIGHLEWSGARWLWGSQSGMFLSYNDLFDIALKIAELTH